MDALGGISPAYFSLDVHAAPTYSANITGNRPLLLTPDLQGEVLFVLFRSLTIEQPLDHATLSNGVFLKSEDLMLILDQHNTERTKKSQPYRIVCETFDPMLIGALSTSEFIKNLK